MSITRSINSGSGYSPTNQQLSNLSTTYNPSTSPQPGSGLKVNGFNSGGQFNQSTIQIIQGGDGLYQTSDLLDIDGTTGTKATIEIDKGDKIEARINAVSYTHLTLPTIYSV